LHISVDLSPFDPCIASGAGPEALAVVAKAEAVAPDIGTVRSGVGRRSVYGEASRVWGGIACVGRHRVYGEALCMVYTVQCILHTIVYRVVYNRGDV
jgi:hypothetical protein